MYNSATRQLQPCTRELCPHAVESSKLQGTLINYAPFFAEGGESYSIRAGAPESKREVMQDFFGWLSTLPVTRLPLSGQYRRSHLQEEQKQVLVDDGWPQVMADDLFEVLTKYFDEEGNQAQDLLMLGFSEYYSVLDEEVFYSFLLSDDFYYLRDEEWPLVFDDRYAAFVAAVKSRYSAITDDKYGRLQQLQRWRASLSLPPVTVEELCAQEELRSEEECVRLNASNGSDSNEWAVILAIGEFVTPCCSLALSVTVPRA